MPGLSLAHRMTDAVATHFKGKARKELADRLAGDVMVDGRKPKAEP